MKVRVVEPHEWERFRALRLRALREDPAAFGATLEAESALAPEAWQERMTRPGTVRLVAEEGGAWVGLVGVALQPAPEVFGMWVAPEARGRGVGLALLEEAASWARAQGASALALWVNVAQAPAVRLYERAGFRPDGPPHPGTRDPSRTFQRMARPLRS